MEKIINQPKKYGSMVEGQKHYGVSYPTLKHALETGQIKGIKTEAGIWKVLLTDTEDKDVTAIIGRLYEQERLLKALCGHLGVR